MCRSERARRGQDGLVSGLFVPELKIVGLTCKKGLRSRMEDMLARA